MIPTNLIDTGPSARGDHGRLTLLLCPWKWAAKYRARPQPPGSALVRGTLVHVGCAHATALYMLRRMGRPAPPAEQLLNPGDAVRLRARMFREEGCAMTIEEQIALDAVRAWTHRLDTAQPDVIAIEHAVELWAQGGKFVEAPADADQRRALAQSPVWEDQLAYLRLGAPWLHTAKVDMVIKGRDGRFCLVDLKSMAVSTQARNVGFDRSGQMIGITAWGLRAYGSQYGGTYIQPIICADSKGVPLPVEVPRMFATRATPEPLAHFAWRIEDSENRAIMLAPRDPRTWTRALAEQGPCTDRYGACPMAEACLEGI